MMDSNIILSYILLFAGIAIWAALIPGRKKVPPKAMDAITVFGGAFLLASCFINLVPHMFAQGFATPGTHIKIGLSVLVGFVIQYLLESLTDGVEHGHNHCHSCAAEHHHAAEETCLHTHGHERHRHIAGHHPVGGLIIGLSIHAFLEGMPLIDSDGEMHQSLLIGILLHNIPISLVLVSLFMHNRFSFIKSLLLLSIFAVMTPLGSLCNTYLITSDSTFQALIMGVVVGILLHVSVSILFDSETDNRWLKLLLIVAAFAAAYFTPGCPEIYG